MDSGRSAYAAALPQRLCRALDFYAKHLRDRLGSRVHALKLFGSWARGEATERSDVDVWVLVDRLDTETRHVPFEVARDTLLEHELDLTPTVMAVSEWQGLVDRERRIARDIEREGIPL
jgi:predicted nucleotidyltransferase